MFSLGSFIQALENDRELEMRASRDFTARDFREIAQRACESFRAGSLNLFSCFELEGEFALWSTIQNYIQTKNPASAEITKAAEDGNEGALAKAFTLAMKLAFIQLYEKGALRRLQLVDELPPEALRELLQLTGIPATPTVPVVSVETPGLTADDYNRMETSEVRRRYTNDPVFKQQVDALAANGGIHVTEPIVEGRVTARRQRPPASVSTETPEETCAREFKEMPSTAWKQKWLLNQNNRAVADRCALEGKL